MKSSLSLRKNFSQPNQVLVSKKGQKVNQGILSRGAIKGEGEKKLVRVGVAEDNYWLRKSNVEPVIIISAFSDAQLKGLEKDVMRAGVTNFCYLPKPLNLCALRSLVMKMIEE